MLNRWIACVFALALFSGGGSIASAQRPQLCSMITPDGVSAITGGKYASTEQQADYATMAHCGYLGGASSKDNVSILFASGPTAVQRWEQAQQMKPRPVEGFLDKASWEPVQGALSAVSGDKYAEIKVSQSHGDEDTRIGLAKKLAELLFTKL